MLFTNKGDVHTKLSIHDEFGEVSLELITYGKFGNIIMGYNLSHSDVSELYSWLAE